MRMSAGARDVFMRKGDDVAIEGQDVSEIVTLHYHARIQRWTDACMSSRLRLLRVCPIRQTRQNSILF